MHLATLAGDNSVRRAKILLSGGGSGGHITPLLAIADELGAQDPNVILVSVGEHGGKFGDLTKKHNSIHHTRTIFAGKFRRYHGESLLRKLLDFKTNLLNIRDALFVLMGIVQAIVLVKRENPDVVFLKGGFVGVPIGIAAAFWHIPIITHDSDALPGLANRLVSRWAVKHATGMPAEFYQYDPSKVEHVGVLVSKLYAPVSILQQKSFRAEIGLPEQGRVLFVTGGSLGSRRLNKAIITSVNLLLQKYSDLSIIHQVGKGNLAMYGDYRHDRLLVLEFLDGMHRYSGAADVIVTRAGANTIAEFGIQTKACIVVPSPFLAGGHQLKNGEYLREEEAAIIVDETAMMKDPSVLQSSIEKLIEDKEVRQKLANKLHNITVDDAAHKLAVLLLKAAKTD